MITITIPLNEFVKVLQSINDFGELLNDFDECIDNEDLANYADNARSAFGDGIEMASKLPLFEQFYDEVLGRHSPNVGYRCNICGRLTKDYHNHEVQE